MSFLLGIDFDYVYMILDSRSVDDGEETAISGPRAVKPTFLINQISAYEMRGKYLTFRVVDPQTSKTELYCIESAQVRQIHNKIDFILRKLKGMSVPGNT